MSVKTLPIENKNILISEFVGIVLGSSTLTYFLFVSINSNFVLLIYLMFILLILILYVFRFNKKNIKTVMLVNNELWVSSNKKLIKIPLKDVNRVTVGLNHFIDKQGLSKRYVLHLSSSYFFGNKIELKYNLKPDENFKNSEPESIRYIKEFVK